MQILDVNNSFLSFLLLGTCKWRDSSCIFTVPQTRHFQACDGHNLLIANHKLHKFIPNLCHASFWQPRVYLHHQKEQAMPKVGSRRGTPFLRRTHILHSSSFSLLEKLGTPNWGHGSGPFDVCLSMFHVDFNQKTTDQWCNVESQFGTWLLWHRNQYFVNSCCSMELSWQWLECQFLQTLRTDKSNRACSIFFFWANQLDFFCL